MWRVARQKNVALTRIERNKENESNKTKPIKTVRDKDMMIDKIAVAFFGIRSEAEVRNWLKRDNRFSRYT